MIARLSDRSKKIKPSFTLEMTSRAAKLRSQGIDVINFSAGQPDFNTPKNIIIFEATRLNSELRKKYTKFTAINCPIIPIHLNATYVDFLKEKYFEVSKNFIFICQDSAHL